MSYPVLDSFAESGADSTRCGIVIRKQYFQPEGVVAGKSSVVGGEETGDRRQESQNEACTNISLGAHIVFPLL